MADLLATGDAWLAERLQTACSQSVTYSRTIRGVTYAVSLLATMGRSQLEAQTGDGFTEILETSDWLFPAADLVLNGSQTTPQAGDRIAAGGKTYQVMSPGGAACYRFSDGAREQLRAHTTIVD